MDTRPIGMFDSGVGGLTVFREIQKMLPNENIIYLGDTKRFPYGSKSKEAIIEISRKCTEFLISQNVKMIIIACGTATSQSIEILKKEFDLPIVGIIEPTVEYMQKNNRHKRIGVIATKGTIRSKAWENKIKEKMSDVTIISEDAPLLATMAEEGWINNKVAKYTIKEYMKCFKKADTLILGCTHYPVFEELIRKSLKKKVEIINTGEKVAIYVKNHLQKFNLENTSDEKKYQKIFLTDMDNSFKNTAKHFISDIDALDTIEQINID